MVVDQAPPQGMHDRHSPKAAVRGSFWCDAAAHLCDSRMLWMGGQACWTPEQALAWIGWRAGHVADQLDDHLARPVRAWIQDHAEHQRAIGQLVRGITYGFVVCDGSVQFVLAATPGAFDSDGESAP
ncbi:hypothetical protein AB0M68_28460 [Streptomyces sp. NPDC051453]|uniref:hypothetical protein n=1 Tax=Streptomyces sp. NPDC051453 TaxID=3154941 RepID=UPI003428F02E